MNELQILMDAIKKENEVYNKIFNVINKKMVMPIGIERERS